MGNIYIYVYGFDKLISNYSFQGNIVKRTLPFLHVGSHLITLTVPLISVQCMYYVYVLLCINELYYVHAVHGQHYFIYLSH